MDWSHLAWELPSESHIKKKDKRKEVRVRRRRRRKQLLDDLKRRGYRNLKEEALWKEQWINE